MEEEQFLLNTDFPVISFLSLLEEVLVLCQLLGVWESDTIDSLESIVLLVS